jgi:hypothetical protein
MSRVDLSMSFFHCTYHWTCDYHMSYKCATSPIHMCHMSSTDWTISTTVCTVSVIPYHVSLYGHDTCHPCSGDMCHFPVGPPVLSTSTSVCPVNLTTLSAMSGVWLYGQYSQLPCGTVRTVQTVQSTFFSYLEK